ncbi:beta-lactamase/transpeptidase-like protein [Hymenopellis radicata]|nr:beta-lactamase/transpeptidase-like protein [Hymenopellis radicata]
MFLSLLFFISAVFALPSHLPTRSEEGILLAPDIDAFTESILRDWGSPGGLSVAAVYMNASDGSWTVETKGYGNASSDGTPVTPETLFSIGSTQSFSRPNSWDVACQRDAVAAFHLEDQDIVAHAGVGSYGRYRCVSEQHCRSSEPSHWSRPHDFMYAKADTISSIMSRTKYLKPSLEFRDAWQYNNIMYAIASYLPTTLVGVPFARYVKEHIFDPLNLSATYSSIVASESGHLAQGFDRDGIEYTGDFFTTGTPVAIPYWNPDVDEDGAPWSGMGGIIMNGRDIATFLQTMLLGGVSPTSGEQVIPSEAVEFVSNGVTVVPSAGITNVPGTGTVSAYGAGQSSTDYQGHLLIEHDGSVSGFHSVISRFPADNFGVAVFSNDETFGPLIMQIVKYQIMDRFLGLEHTDWNNTYYQLAAAIMASMASKTSLPNASSASVAYEDLAGSYTNEGYGYLDLCFVSDSSACTDILETLPTAIGDQPMLIAKWDKLWTSHLRLQHYDGDVWNVSLLNSLDIVDSAGNSTGQYRFADTSRYNAMTAEFAFDEGGAVSGFGMSGGFWGEVLEMDGDNVEALSEVWFSRSS